MAMLEVHDINVYYGAIHAIKGISFEVNEGEIVTLIGANGSTPAPAPSPSRGRTSPARPLTSWWARGWLRSPRAGLSSSR